MNVGKVNIENGGTESNGAVFAVSVGSLGVRAHGLFRLGVISALECGSRTPKQAFLGTDGLSK